MGQAPGTVGRSDSYPDNANDERFVDADASAGNDTEMIVEDIEVTRTEMSGTIDAIQERLSPEHLKDQAKEMVRDATVGKAHEMMHTAGDTARDTGNGILDTIRQNPLPAAIAGIGIGWLWKNRSRSRPHAMNYRYDGYRDDRDMSGSQPYYYQPESMLRNSRTSNIGGAVTDTASNVADTASNIASGVSHTAGQAVDQVTSATHQAVEGVGHLGAQAGSSMRSNYDHMMQESPMTLGVVAVGLGLAIGMMLPETETEDRVMGETKENLMDKAQTMAQDTMDKVQEVASQAQDTIQQSAQDQGLTATT